MDILIATHRMLAKDLAFRDLGLLIVDEEQRFGVAQKERLKEWKASIDVLSMSATPIPRSLHLSLSGLRDLSIIETPPRDRLAIETQVVPSKPEIIREAIEAEIARGGQVFFVHNRIESIGRGIERCSRSCSRRCASPSAHGQMPEGELEKAMRRFVSREADVLLATAIVENGLDIPSANTILIDRADTFGLAQLYQLRGRVGRSDKPAYAYLLVPGDGGAVGRRAPAPRVDPRVLRPRRRVPHRGPGPRDPGLGKHARRRAVRPHRGRRLRDVPVAPRGGDPRDPRRGAAARARGHALARRSTSRSPTSYVEDENWRMMIYKKIARAGDDAALAETAREIADRFGEPPAEVRRLVQYARLRARAEGLGVTAITRQAGKVHVRFSEDASVDADRVLDFVSRTPGSSLSPSRVLTLPAPSGGDELLAGLIALLPTLERRAA